MKPSLKPLILLAATVLATVFTLAAQSPGPPVSIVISAPTSVKAGSPILLNTTMANISNRGLTVFFEDTSHNEFNYDFVVRDADGRPGLETRYMKDVKGDDLVPGSQKAFTGHLGPGGYMMKPGETIKSTTDLSQLFVLSPGQYTVQLSWFENFTIWRDPHKQRPPDGVMVVKSNIVTVTVTP